MEHLYRRRIPPEKVVTLDVARECADLTFETRRQIGLLVNRQGQIESVIIGNGHELVIPNLSRTRSGLRLLRGVRLVHTHLKNQPLTQDDLTDLALLRLDLIMALGVGKSGGLQDVYVAHNVPNSANDQAYVQLKPCAFESFQLNCQEFIQTLEQDILKGCQVSREGIREGRALLVSVGTGHMAFQQERMDELQELVRAQDVEVLGCVTQRPAAIHPKYVVGSGKMKELAIQALQSGADTLIFDQDLTPAQVRGISEITDLRVLDRSQVILDIFAKRAHSHIGNIQVELAQLRYRLPRLAQSSTAFSRLAGGIGTRGPGETKLETDRRRIRERIQHLERDLASIGQGRQEQRKRRMKRGLPVVSIIGYTNAGKSTLFNAWSDSHVSVKDRVFETLDTVSRRWHLPGVGEVILTDTVGFIRDLPKDLVAAFQTTLQELQEADVLVHVIDAHAPDPEQHIRAVEHVLTELGFENIPRLRFFNKGDLLESEDLQRLCQRYEGIGGSALDVTSL
ncbi:MAG: GTPase HflX, partial [Nitrospirota bacterium]|nr:GTPase HflX [Nitrospirota bacterium]MDX2420086.1 GTPase HflX [Nitrospirota bacterium]